MAQPQLRVFVGPEEVGVETAESPAQVRVALSDILPALLDAARSDRGWVGDFADEEVAISQDLYDVVMAYQYFCRPSA